jgi:hypothetical protein
LDYVEYEPECEMIEDDAPPRYDFVTCNNAEPPHVKIYSTADEKTFATIYIHDGKDFEAETLASDLVERLNR